MAHERATQDGLCFCTLYESLLPRGDCMYAPDILMFSTGSQEYLTVGLLHGK